jgi:lysophospholipid acyltransferase (LPLAT)-like uncharacterized protein
MKHLALKFIARSFAPVVLKLWFRSLRWTAEPHFENDGPRIFGFWHQDIFAVVGFFSIQIKRKALTALVSASQDGEILKSILEKLDFKTVRGSSSNNGFPALISLDQELDSGSVLITPDGPKGPARKLKPGIIHLARYSQKPVVLIRVEYQSYWRLNSWDQFIIPKPFSKCQCRASRPFFVDRSPVESDAVCISETMEDTLNGCETRPAVEESNY